MNLSDVLVVQSGGNGPGCLIELAQVIAERGERPHMLHDDLVGLGSETKDLETANGKHLVVVLAIVNGYELVKELLLCGEECVCRNPVLRIAHPLACLLYTSPSPRDQRGSRMPSSA